MGPVEALFVVTAYAFGCGANGFTFVERIPDVTRTVAVDPRVVPLYSALAIEGFGIRIAEDTGRMIRGRRIDVFMGSCREAREFGVQRLYALVMPLGLGAPEEEGARGPYWRGREARFE